METKNTSMNKSKQLLIHHLLEKKNWAVLTLIVLIITVMILPMLMDTDISEEYIAMGVAEVFIVILVNCLIDFNYLHDSKKYGYYLSKPISSIKRIHMVLISNALFATFFMGLLCLIGIILKLEIFEMFLVSSAWLLMLILLTSLSSLLSGNTIIAGLSTAFNFALPLFIMGVMYFAMDIVGDIVIGINVDIIMDYIIQNIYKIESLYLIEYGYNMSIMYFVVLGCNCLVIYGFMRWALKHRKNERIGEHIVFNGYKYFIALIFSIMVPFIFTNALYNHEYVTKLISFVILGTLTYYVALVILEKSFTLKKVAIKLLVIFMVVFLSIVLASGFAVKLIEKNIPDISEIDSIFVSSTDYILLPGDNDYVHLRDIDTEDVEKIKLPVYQSDEAKQLVLDLHKSLIDNPNYYYHTNVNIVYYLKDGSKTSRYFDLGYHGEDYNEKLEVILTKLMSTKEHKKIVYPFFYNDDYRNSLKNIRIEMSSKSYNEKIYLSKSEVEQFAFAVKQDIDYYLGHKDDGVVTIGYQDNYINFPSVIKGDDYEGDIENDYLYIEIWSGDSRFKNFDIPGYFVHTRAFIEDLN
ncbi:MAG: hypothetical protein JEZ08_10300 [Clostridiales bacterium]|nr:hypothetical protein [Clostridiales bacterium]